MTALSNVAGPLGQFDRLFVNGVEITSSSLFNTNSLQSYSADSGISLTAATGNNIDVNTGGSGKFQINGVPISNANLSIFVAAQQTSDFTAESGNYYAVSTDQIAAIVIGKPASPTQGDQILIASKGQGAENFAPDISDFNGLTMTVGTNTTVTFFSSSNLWLVTSEF